jgi:integrase
MMAADRVKTKTPGIYKRGSRYVFSYREHGRQHWESARTLEDARRKRATRETAIANGEADSHSRETLHEYAKAWVDRYQGRNNKGFREGTRKEYRRQLDQYVCKFFPPGLKVREITPRRVGEFVGWLTKQTKPAPTKSDPNRRVPLSDATVRRIMAPLCACLATARREGIIRENPARDVDLPNRESAEDSEREDVRGMSRDELASLLDKTPEGWQLLFIFLAASGLRISEAVALQWRHLELDGETPHVKVRRALVKGRVGPPKSRRGRRQVPLSPTLAMALLAHRAGSEWPREDDPVFPATNGKPLIAENVFRRVLQPARELAGLPWVGFHTFRHTCASLLFAEGRNAVQVQRWLGHHSASFTLATYVHLLDGDLGEPLSVTTPAQAVTTSLTTHDPIGTRS